MEILLKKYGSLISSRLFTMNDQEKFSKFSADSNPIHIDPTSARRTINGECIVHGIHGLMWALNEFIKEYALIIDSFAAQFHKQISLEKIVYLFWNSRNKKLIIADEDKLFTTISIEFSGSKYRKNELDLKVGDALLFPKNLTLIECAEIEKSEFIYRGNITYGKVLFPTLFENYSEEIAAEIASTSEIVGMQIPGLNSLFLSINGYFSARQENPSVEVEGVDLRFGLLKIKAQGRYLKCQIEALYRPQSPNMPHINTLKYLVNSNEFSSVKALIIGGSRGLGELTAKLIASGGGHVTITYCQGEADATKIQLEILGSGSCCDILHLNITSSFLLPLGNFNQIYYFPTPKIKPEEGGNSDLKLIDNYRLYYVDGFNSLVTQVLIRSNLIRVFYPSSSFVDNPPKKFIAYAKAKLEGEILSRQFNEKRGMNILYPRLPRMATDQTISITSESFHDSVKTMIPLIRKMTNELYL
jgi:hypothetical protein